MQYTMHIIEEIIKIRSRRNLDNIYEDSFKAKNLDIYLSTMQIKAPKALLLGGAPVYTGSHKTGIPFTDEYEVGTEKVSIEEPEDDKPMLEKSHKWERHKASKKERGAMIIWDNLKLQLDELLLWNIFPFYPHTSETYSISRNLSDAELDLGFQLLESLLKEFQSIKSILVASDLASRILRDHPDFTAKYQMFYVSSPAISGAEEFTNRVKKALEYRVELMTQGDNEALNDVRYEYRRRWAEEDEDGNYYCRMLNEVLTPDKTRYCTVCPCCLGETQYCGYYAFNRKVIGMQPNDIKNQADTLISFNLIPLFPDYIKRTRLADVVVEQALQLAATVYKDRIYTETGEPYLIHILEWLNKVEPYVTKLPLEPQQDVLAALVLYNIYKHSEASPAKLRKDFGDYVMSLISVEDENHKASVTELFDMLEPLEIPDDIMTIFNLLKG